MQNSFRTVAIIVKPMATKTEPYAYLSSYNNFETFRSVILHVIIEKKAVPTLFHRFKFRTAKPWKPYGRKTCIHIAKISGKNADSTHPEVCKLELN